VLEMALRNLLVYEPTSDEADEENQYPGRREKEYTLHN
jgi:hypothetical protein